MSTASKICLNKPLQRFIWIYYYYNDRVYACPSEIKSNLNSRYRFTYAHKIETPSHY